MAHSFLSRYPLNSRDEWRGPEVVMVAPDSLIAPAQKAQLLATLTGLLRDVLRLRREGTAYTKLAAAQGYADGFMRALSDAGICTQPELLGLVAQVRRGVDGPAVTAVVVDVDNAAEAA